MQRREKWGKIGSALLLKTFSQVCISKSNFFNCIEFIFPQNIKINPLVLKYSTQIIKKELCKLYKGINNLFCANSCVFKIKVFSQMLHPWTIYNFIQILELVEFCMHKMDFDSQRRPPSPMDMWRKIYWNFQFDVKLIF